MCKHRTKTLSFTYSSLKLSGVLSTMITTKHSVFMRITSKTTGVNLIYSDTTPSYAKTGRVGPSSLVMRKAARDSNHASTVTDGRSNSSTRSSTRLRNVRSPSASRDLSAPSTTAMRTAALSTPRRWTLNSYMYARREILSALNNPE